MSNKSLANRSFWGALWSFVDIFSRQILTFLIGIILARILSPSDYGLIGVLTIFITLSNVFIEGGFSNALIRKLDRNDRDYSTAFYFNIAVGVVFYMFLYSISPLVASFFDAPILSSLLRVVGLNVLFNSFCIVQNAILTAGLRIRIQTIISISSQIPMGIFAIYLAYKGYGVWALAIQQVGTTFLRTILLWIVAKWRPKSKFDKQSFLYLFNFGSKLVGANLLGTFFNEIYSFVIGKYIGKSSLGYYTKGKSLAEQPKGIITGVIQKVAIPTLVNYQSDKTKLREVYAKYIEVTSFIMFPIMMTLILIAPSLIVVLWTEKWLSVVILFQVLCFGYAWEPIGALNMSLLQVVNRTDYLLKLEFVKKPLLLIILFISIRWGIYGIVIGQACYSILATIINMQITRNILSYRYRDQFKDILKYFLCALFPLILGCFLLKDISSPFIQILTSFLLILLVYLGLNVLFKLPAMKYLRRLICERSKL